MPKVLNRYKDYPATQAQKLWPENLVYIGRGSKWGNPFVIGKDGSRQDVIRKYRKWFYSQPELVEACRNELKDKDLVCFCAPLNCHGEVLLEEANGK